ncbi:Mss4-like protein [Lipomyces mesembrius]
MTSTTTVLAACLCGSNSHPISFPKSSLPVPVHLCHCDTTRHVSGLLCSSYVPIPDAPFPVTSLTQYHSSPEVTRYFCSTCGAPMFVKVRGSQPEADRLEVATGAKKH